MTMPKRTPPKILAVKSTDRSTKVQCPACRSRLGNLEALARYYSGYCPTCNAVVFNRYGFNTATRNGPAPALQEIRDFLHPPAPVAVGDRAAALEEVGQLRDLVAPGVTFKNPLPRSKPSGRLAKYEPRALAHERQPSRWAWRTVYAVVTLTGALVALWQALRVSP